MSKEIVINVVKTLVEPIKIKLPMYFYMEDYPEYDTEYGMYVMIDEEMTALIYERKYVHYWRDERPIYPARITFSTDMIRNYYPNELEIANQITQEQFEKGVQEFWTEFQKEAVKFGHRI